MEADLRQFMFDRGISPQTIKLMEEDKVSTVLGLWYALRWARVNCKLRNCESDKV